MRVPRLLLLLGLWCCSAVRAAPPVPPPPHAAAVGTESASEATNETFVFSTAHVSVLYEGRELEAYARAVAERAETELLRVAALFERQPFPVRVRVDRSVDAFNAFASPLPRPQVVLRARTPYDGVIGWRGDLLARVLRHELTHVVQLTDRRLPEGTEAPARLGLVSEASAVLPPAWFLEGVAVWVESQVGEGGRLHDPRTRATLWTLAAADALPSLASASLATYGDWPAGETRYLLGASFLDHLVRGHGWAAVLATLRSFQADGGLRSFAAAWEGVTGTSLDAEWRAWGDGLRSEAEARSLDTRPHRLTERGGHVGAPAVSPDGGLLAWREDDGVWIASFEAGALAPSRRLVAMDGVESLSWLNDTAIVFSATARDPGARPMDLFALDVGSGKVRRLTREAHAHLPRADGRGCVLYLRDRLLAGSALLRWCEHGSGSTTTVVWRAPTGTHAVGLSAPSEGRIALSLVSPGTVDAPGGPVGLYVLEGGTIRPVRAAAELGNVTDPAWSDADTLLVTGDASGLKQTYAVAVDDYLPVDEGGRGAVGGSSRPMPLSRSLGGATHAVSTPIGVVAVGLGATGYDLVLLGDRSRAVGSAAGDVASPVDSEAASPVDRDVAGPAPGVAEAPRSPADPSEAMPDAMPDATRPTRSSYLPPAPQGAASSFTVRPYTPWESLAPYGWLPSLTRFDVAPLGAGVELLVPALDDSGRHALEARVGYDTGLQGPLGGGYASLAYAWNMPNLLPALRAPPVIGMAVRVGAWPHVAHLRPVSEVAYGFRADALVRLPVGRRAGSLGLRVDLIDAPTLPAWSVEARLDGVVSDLRGDRFGAPVRGSAYALRARWTATAAGPSLGAWGEAGWWTRVGSVPLGIGLRAGYRPSPGIPVALAPVSALASAGTRIEVPVAWRFDDGLLALERVDVEPAVRTWAGSDGSFGIGADLTAWADVVLDYEAVMRLGVRGGYADGVWASVALDLPFGAASAVPATGFSSP